VRKRPRILVVDDEAAVKDVVGDLLTEGGYDVATASTCEAALAAVAEQVFDIVISDVRLADGRGDRLVDEIVRRRPGLANRIILLTGDVADLPGPRLVIRKPFDLDAVLNAVEDRLAAA
jgi:two-component system, NtrC family, sensor histidine kinase HydH